LGESTMKAVSSRAIAALALAVAALLSAPISAAADPDRPGAPLLTLQDAVEIAHRNNHLLASTARVVSQAGEPESALQARRFHALHLDAFGGHVSSSDISIPPGTLVGGVPQGNSINPGSAWIGAGLASVSQPLTQQYKIGLGVDIVRFDRDVAVEDL